MRGNTRAERFWDLRGYNELRRREGQVYVALAHTVKVMLKVLRTRGLKDYLAQVARDRA